MNRFNEYMAHHFQAGGCRLLGKGHDPHRGRDVSVHAMPGYSDVLGVSDGTDAWIVPAVVGTYFGTDLAEQVRRLQKGEELNPPVIPAPRRQRVRLEPDPQPAAAAASTSERKQRVRL